MTTSSCPSWCEGHHPTAPHQSVTAGRIETGDHHYVFVRVLQTPGWQAPQVAVLSTRPGYTALLLTQEDATNLATLLQEIGSADLAQLVRDAVALIKEAS